MDYMQIAVNTRILAYRLTGAQRYLSEIMSHVGSQLRPIFPKRSIRSSYEAHLWEQTVLPFRKGQSLLWSPSNTGPLFVRNQVVTIHDLVQLDHPEWFNPHYAMWYNLAVPMVAKVAHRVIAVSEFSKGRIIDKIGVNENKITVIPGGVSARFSPAGVERIAQVRDAVGIKTPYYILSLGTLERRKNLARLMLAWQRTCPALRKDIWLVIAGGRSELYRDPSLPSNIPRVHFTGPVRDDYLPALYSGAMAFFYLSEYEGFGLPPLEAMACGTPTVTGNRTSLPEVVGDGAITVNPLDVDEIVDAIRSLANDSSLAARLRDSGLKRAGMFSWAHTAEMTLDLLKAASREVA